jgi:hypothetical protein
MNVLIRALTLATLMASALCREVHGGKVIAGSAKVRYASVLSSMHPAKRFTAFIMVNIYNQNFGPTAWHALILLSKPASPGYLRYQIKPSFLKDGTNSTLEHEAAKS